MQDKNGWNRFTIKTMPPVRTTILVWCDVGHNGFPIVANVNKDGRIFYWIGCEQREIDHSRFRGSRWKGIKPPEGEDE